MVVSSPKIAYNGATATKQRLVPRIGWWIQITEGDQRLKNAANCIR